MDVQGADRARPYVEEAKATFTALVDEHDLLGQMFGFKAVPNTFLIDESGSLVASRPNREEIERFPSRPKADAPAAGPHHPPQTIADLETAVSWNPEDADATVRLARACAAQGRHRRALELLTAVTSQHAESPAAWFELAAVQLHLGRREAAIDALKSALRAQPGNYIIKKQIWALENPERFYDGPVDYDWQRRQP